jgi:hypothetical protein
MFVTRAFSISAVGLVAMSGASAADLGAAKPSPVEYVRACYNSLWGASGGFVVPGTQTCLRVAGQARFDYQWSEQFTRRNSPLGWRGGMAITFDAIGASEYGNVRSFASIGAVYRSGNQSSASNLRKGIAIGGAFPAGTNSAGQTEINYSGFIQFAGFTLGRTSSFFRSVGKPPEIIGLTWLTDPGSLTTLAYTAQLGNGFVATIAIEDPTTGRSGVVTRSLAFGNGTIAVANLSSSFGATPGFLTPDILGAPSVAATNLAQIGNRMPNIVAAVRVDQSWGSAELSGMVNEVGMVGNIPIFDQANGLFTGTLASPGARYGLSINGGLKINLPMVASGDNLTLNAVYSQGNLSTVFSNNIGNLGTNLNTGGVAAILADGTVNQITGKLRLTTTWAVTAGFQHFWSPTLSSTVFGSYAKVDVASTPLAVTDALRDFSLLTLGVNTVWQPVRGLNIGLEGALVRQEVQGRMLDVNKLAFTAAGGSGLLLTGCNTLTGSGCSLSGSGAALQTRLRVTRDF